MKRNNTAQWLILLIIMANLLVLPLLQAETGLDSQLNNEAPLEIYIRRARQLKLAEQSGWLNLLHYKKALLGEVGSQADGMNFYLAENGANDAQAELEADLRGFFSKQAVAHPQCRFPARVHWLNAQLDFKNHMPVTNCSKFNKWKQKFRAKQITLLFPSMHLDNPASMFGHTFLRFDRSDNNLLLSQTLSYAASYDESDSFFVYSWKGITGGYAGEFFLRPYFETLQVYSDIEQRDIWEYTLNLNQQEIDQLIRHLWEVRGIHFEYYFLRENCAYRLLALLDVARENINMSMDSHLLYAIPVDTVRDIKRAGLISSSHYRPSTHNKILQMSEQAGDEARQFAFSVANNEWPAEEILLQFDAHQQLQILQLAGEILNQNKMQTAETEALQLKLLSVRSKLPAASEQQSFNFNSDSPESAHQSARWQLSTGEREYQKFYEIGLRPAFHDLLDPSQGFNNGASISVLETRLRWYKEGEKFKLEQLNLFSMRSLVPVRPWVTPLSRQISFQLKKRDKNSRTRITEFESQFATGYTADIKSVLTYVMVTAQFDYATELKNNHALYLGIDTGLLWSHKNKLFASPVSWQAEMRYQNSQQISGEKGDIQKIKVGIQVDLIQNHAIRFGYEYIDYGSFDVTEGKFSYFIYF